jgi:hypothetical protein
MLGIQAARRRSRTSFFIGAGGMSRDRALYEAREWLEAVILSLELATRNLDPWLIRRDGERVATLSVGFRAPILDILQLKGPANAEAPNEIWVATRRWIDRHDLMAIERAWAPHQEVPFDRAAWVASWRPFWLAKRRIPSWLPLRPSRGALDRLFNSRR